MAKIGRPSVSFLVEGVLHKECPTCREVKPHADYGACAGRAHGIRPHCKKCSSAKANAWNHANKPRHLENVARWRRDNPERNAAASAAWHEANRTYKNASALNWYHENPQRSQATKSRRRIAARSATRPFDPDLYDLVEREAFDLAQLRNLMVGGVWHVDHVVPVVSPRLTTLGGPINLRSFCGPTFPAVQALHNEFNFAVIPRRTNISKGNRSWPDMP